MSHTTLVYVHVKADHIEQFLTATRANHVASLMEKGNLRFDVLQQEADPTRFVLYESYRSEADAQAHKQTPHYLQWRETVAAWMAEPRQGVVHRGLLPE